MVRSPATVFSFDAGGSELRREITVVKLDVAVTEHDPKLRQIDRARVQVLHGGNGRVMALGNKVVVYKSGLSISGLPQPQVVGCSRYLGYQNNRLNALIHLSND